MKQKLNMYMQWARKKMKFITGVSNVQTFQDRQTTRGSGIKLRQQLRQVFY